jgi:RHH-type proline utilization regulon transcriptional repressor/proline dehydrogenase/delta 1-pyrroline-5-carboxylate dehydrogenase
VRRLLENGANSSFVHQVVDPSTSLEDLIADPVQRLAKLEPKPHPAIRRPPELFAPQRENAPGFDLSDPLALSGLKRRLEEAARQQYAARPGVEAGRLERRPVRDPSDRRRTLGEVAFADAPTAERALAVAHAGFAGWSRVLVADRAAILDRAAELFAEDAGSLIYLCCREGGRTLADSIADWREAVDFLRYYAAEARRLLAEPIPAARAHGRGEPAPAASARRVRHHQPVELPARDLRRPGRGGAVRGQRRDSEAGRGHLAHGRGRGRTPAPRRRARGRARAGAR